MNRFTKHPEPTSKRVAFLEDDQIIGNILKTAMCDAGFEVDWFTSGLECLKAIKKFHYDVCVLDWLVPDVSGPDVMRVIREHQKSNDLPIIFVTSRAAEEDVIEMLARGADDYIVKPASGAILAARINALLRRAGHAAPHQERKWGDLRVNFTSKIIYHNEVKVDLTKRELELALFLFDNLERLLTRSHILKVVWQHSPDVDSRKIDVYISGLRKKTAAFFCVRLGTDLGIWAGLSTRMVGPQRYSRDGQRRLGTNLRQGIGPGGGNINGIFKEANSDC